MKKSVTIISYICIGLFLSSLLYISILAWANPETVMAFVEVELNNNDAKSSIRGVYGGVGFFLVGLALIISIRNLQHGLLFFTAFWLMYAVSRILTTIVDGPLEAFGNTWLKIELSFGLLSLTLYLLRRYVLKIKMARFANA
ncbi:protein of unknown function [Chitinophaga costaii]|uniref:DUF4345 domain-containing protein n=1 Tax=Chitinophaga costaii TaxID=1335309 RepID=A0A1C4BAM1_9BACT|nr:DUF4345 domain-containing protein [Chitinophaga costaii]PUZ27688.1 DUF4345 domain-containing protein [Chitinophaga costaii]SCC03802.1 protein of unknown function [Chitinophaga costaii]